MDIILFLFNILHTEFIFKIVFYLDLFETVPCRLFLCDPPWKGLDAC